MNYLSVENLTKSFSDKILFENIAFGIDQGQKVALVGINGCGKSTLLKIIGGEEQAETGKVSFKNGIKVSYLSQNPSFKSGNSVIDAVFDSNEPKLKLIRDYELALLLAETDENAHEKLTPLMEQMDALQAWDYESEVHQILGKLGIHDLTQKIDGLSGGQQKRVALARTLVEKPDLLIMDEPTNHLDLGIIEWLEDYLSMQNLSLLLVTHDRYFLENITNQIIEIDQSKIFKYEGNYSEFLEQKAVREEQERVVIGKAKNLMKKELDWIRRQPKARGTKAKYRIEAFEEIKKVALQKKESKEITLDVTAKRQGKKILELDKVTKSFGGKEVILPFSYVFQRGERIGIIGENGTGKSTFLNMITKQMKPDSGKIEIGQNTVYGYYTQKELDFKPEQKVIDIVKDVAEVITMSDGSVITASYFLQHFQFAPKVQHDFVEKLSGGEKRRLQLLKVLMKNPNFLILDEPTNDLDLMTLGILEDFLDQFTGCLVIVSHDRYFMDRLVEHVFVLETGKVIKNLPYNYSQFRAWKEIQQEEKQQINKDKVKVKKEKSISTKMSFKEKTEYEGLEGEIEKLEQLKEVLVTQLNEGNGSHEELAKWAKEVKELILQIEEKEMRWLELSEMIS